MDLKWENIAAINLKSVRAKFLRKKSWWWLCCNNPARIEREYRQFLYLVAMNPGAAIVPWSQDLDDFWHEHILDTAKYAEDCQKALGQFLHHNPHVPKGSLNHGRALADTRELYRAAFREKAEKRRRRSSSCAAGCSSDAHFVFCSSRTSSSHHHGGGSNHGGGHHDTGHHGAHDGGGHHGGHSCGSHGGHSCGGHGCGGHGCGGGGH